MARSRRRSRRRAQSGSAPLAVVVGVVVVLWLFGYLADNAPFVLVMLAVLAATGTGLYLWFRVRRRQRWLARVSALGDLLVLTPTQFELAVGELLGAWGYRNVRHTGGGGDLAADLICHTPDGQQLVVVQCKRYAPGNAVGSPDVQKFIGMLTVHHRAHQGIFVTTSSFTQPALALARQHNLLTIDGQQLAGYIQQVQARRQQQQLP